VSDDLVPGVRHLDVSANGLRFHVAELGEGPKLALLLHGFPECWLSWRHQLPLLAKLGYRCWAPSLRGYGRSDRPPAVRDYAIERLLGDVAGWIDASGAEEVTLVGHDWGGLIAWYFAMRRVRPLARLVQMNIPHPTAAHGRFRNARQLLRSSYALFFQIPWLPERALFARRHRIAEILRDSGLPEDRMPPEVAAVYAETIGAPGAARGMIHYYRALVRGGAARQRRAGSPVIDTPTLLIWGEDDVALGKELTYGTGDWVSDLTLRYLPGVSHWVQLHVPETVNAMLEAFLTGHPVPEAGAV